MVEIKKSDDFIEIVFKESIKEQENQVKLGMDLYKQIKEIYGENPEIRFKLMLDLTKPGLYVDASSFKAVKIYQKIVDTEQTEKMAVLGRSHFADIVTEVALPRIAKKKVQWFTERKKALWWLGVKSVESD